MNACVHPRRLHWHLGPALAAAAVAAALLIPPARAASTNAPRAVALTLAQTIERALAHSTALAARRFDSHAAHDAIPTAPDLRDPELRLSYGEGTGDSLGLSDSTAITTTALGAPSSTSSGRATETKTIDEDGSRIGLRVFPPNPWLYRAQQDQARAEAREMDARYQLEAATLAADVAEQFCTAAYLARDLALLQDAVALHTARLATSRATYEAGRATLEEHLLLVKNYATARLRRDRVLRELVQVRHELAVLTGVSAERVVPRRDAPLAPPAHEWLAPDSQAAARQLAQRGSVLAAAARREGAAALLQEARAARIPWIDAVEFAYGRSSSREDATQQGLETQQQPGELESQLGTQRTIEEQDDEEWRADIAVTLPVLTWARGGLAARTRHLRTAARDQAAAAAAAHHELAEAVAGYQAAQARRADYSRIAMPVAGALEDGAGKLAREGATQDAVQEFRESAIEVRRAQAELELACDLAAIAIYRALGLPPAP